MSRKKYTLGEIWYAEIEEPHTRHLCVKYHGNGVRALADTLCGSTLEFWRFPQFHAENGRHAIQFQTTEIGDFPGSQGCKECHKRMLAQ